MIILAAVWQRRDREKQPVLLKEFGAHPVFTVIAKSGQRYVQGANRLLVDGCGNRYGSLGRVDGSCVEGS